MKKLLFLLATIPIGFALAMLIVVPILQPPPSDVQQLFVFMAFTGGATVLITYWLAQQGAVHRFSSIRWTLLALILLTVMLIMVNVWLVAQWMYISYHDLVLTAALLVFAGLISTVSVFFVADSLVGRISALRHVTQQVAQGNLNARLKIDGRDEFSQLSISFNGMADSLLAVDRQKRELEQARRDLIASISHDLRTPLAAMRAMNEAILDGIVTDLETVTRYNQDIGREIRHLSGLIDDLFELSLLESGQMRLVREQTSLCDLISDSLSSFTPRAAQQQITFQSQIDPQLGLVNIAPDKILRVIHNLLDNALGHTPAGGTIRVTIGMLHEQVRISVHNDGQPIAPADLPHIFERFYQGEPSRVQNYKSRGTGLGLAIARAFVEAHDGKIWAESEPTHGTAFIFTLPLVSRLDG